MTGLSFLLFALAGVLLFAAVLAIYAREREWWNPDEDPEAIFDRVHQHARIRVRTVASVTPETAEIKLGDDAAVDAPRPREFTGEVFRYTLKRPNSAVRRRVPDLGGFSEVPLRLYDQLGNRFTVHQKVR